MPNETAPPPTSPQTGSNATQVRVVLPGPLLRLFSESERELVVSAAHVDELLDALDARWPGMRDRLCDSRPAIRKHINIFVDGTSAELETALPPGAEVFILTAMSGG
jgi:molybdopterin synthase sulfur carrier subunit